MATRNKRLDDLFYQALKEDLLATVVPGWAANFSLRREMSYEAHQRFFFVLIGFALLMVWLTQQLYPY